MRFCECRRRNKVFLLLRFSDMRACSNFDSEAKLQKFYF
jgi:hypothetical protein